VTAASPRRQAVTSPFLERLRLDTPRRPVRKATPTGSASLSRVRGGGEPHLCGPLCGPPSSSRIDRLSELEARRGALAELHPADGIRAAARIADLRRWAVAEAGQVAGDHVADDLRGVRRTEIADGDTHLGVRLARDTEASVQPDPRLLLGLASLAAPSARKCSSER